MPDSILIHIDGVETSVRAGTTLAAALLAAGFPGVRKSVSGEVRGPLCGMGICFECRVTVDGMPHVKSCQVMCRPGLDVRLA